jgi:hypothetical protein
MSRYFFACPQPGPAGTKKEKKKVSFGHILNAFGEEPKAAFFKFEKLGENF